MFHLGRPTARKTAALVLVLLGVIPKGAAFYFPCDTLLARYDAGRNPNPTPELNASFPNYALTNVREVGPVPGSPGAYNGYRIDAHTAHFEQPLDEPTLAAAMQTGWELRLRMQIVAGGSKDTYAVVNTFDGSRLIIFWNDVTAASARIGFDFADTGSVVAPGSDGQFHDFVFRGHPTAGNTSTFDVWVDGKHSGNFTAEGNPGAGQTTPFGVAVGSSSGTGNAIWNHISFSSGCAAVTVPGVAVDARFDQAATSSDAVSIHDAFSSVIFDSPTNAVRMGLIDDGGAAAVSIVAPGGFKVDGVDVEAALASLLGGPAAVAAGKTPTTTSQVQIASGLGLVWSGAASGSAAPLPALYAAAGGALVLDGELLVQGMGVAQTLRRLVAGLPASPVSGLAPESYGIDLVAAMAAVRFPTAASGVFADVVGQAFAAEDVARGSPLAALSVDRKLYVNGIDIYEAISISF